MTTLHLGIFHVEVEPLSKGLYELFTDDEKEIVRFGMLPAEKMDTFAENLRKRIKPGTYRKPDEEDFDKRMIDISEAEAEHYVSEILRNVTVGIYNLCDMIV